MPHKIEMFNKELCAKKPKINVMSTITIPNPFQKHLIRHPHILIHPSKVTIISQPTLLLYPDRLRLCAIAHNIGQDIIYY